MKRVCILGSVYGGARALWRMTALVAYTTLIHTPLAFATGEDIPPPFLVKDIRTTPRISSFDWCRTSADFARLGDAVYFLSNGEWERPNLWRTDGTKEGTFVVSSARSSWGGKIVRAGEWVFFVAGDQASGVEVWKSDGTSSGTTILKDIYPGPKESLPRDLVSCGNLLYFRAQKGPLLEYELWRSDGTAEGTFQLVAPSLGEDYHRAHPPTQLTPFGDILLYVETTWERGTELWKTDGTTSGTMVVKTIRPGPDYAYPMMWNGQILDGSFYFPANDGTHGQEIWKTDGTPEGTMVLKDIRSGSEGSSATVLYPVGHELLFAADDGVHGLELWKTDGTSEGTSLVKDIWPGVDSSSPALLGTFQDHLVFLATDATRGREMWTTDGTPERTHLIRDVVPGSAGPFIQDWKESGQVLILSLDDTVHGSEIWRTDGTEAGTFLVEDLVPGQTGSEPASLFRIAGTVAFTGRDAEGQVVLWSTDGTASATARLMEIPAVQQPTHRFPSPDPVDVGLPIFILNDPANGYTLWRTDGTRQGTELVKRLFPWHSSSRPRGLYSYNGSLMFVAYDNARAYCPWISDGSVEGTHQLIDRAVPENNSWYLENAITTFEKYLFYMGSSTTMRDGIWRSDGTTTNTKYIHKIVSAQEPGEMELAAAENALFFTQNVEIVPYREYIPELWAFPSAFSPPVRLLHGVKASELTPSGNRLFFLGYSEEQGKDLWVSDGTPEGTRMIRDLSQGDFYTYNLSFLGVNGCLYYTYNGLWKSDGTSTGTVPIIGPESSGSDMPRVDKGLVKVGATVYFPGYLSEKGKELWKTDGTPENTYMVKDINLAQYPRYLTYPYNGSSIGWFSELTTADVNGTLFFVADDGIHGFELWKSDGTEEGTVLVKDIRPGPLSSDPFYLRAWNGLCFFSANDGTLGLEPWVSDGTEAGTRLLGDIAPGGMGSYPNELAVAGRHLFFSADDSSGIGREIWAVEFLPKPEWQGTGWIFVFSPPGVTIQP